MAEYTKIETARTIICDFCNQLYSDEPCEPADCDWLRMLEEDAADVAPVRHGRWIDAYPDIEPNPMFMYGICSACGFEQGISKYLKYCPDCGAKMDLEG